MTTATASITEQDVATIRFTIQPWIQACLDRDWDALLSLCTDDITFLPPNEPIVEGQEATRAFLEAYPKITAFTVEFTPIDRRADRATVRGTFSMTVEAEEGEATMNGKFIDTFRRQVDNTWRYREVIWNPDYATG